MNNPNTPRIDLSSLPPTIRARVEQALARLPAEQRQLFEEQGSPLLQKLVARMSQTAGNHAAPPPLPTREAVTTAAKHIVATRIAPKGHYNQTIQPGDRGQGLVRLVVLALVIAVAWTFWP